MVVEILFSHILMYGDEGNMLYIKKLFPNAEFVYTNLYEKPYFAEKRPDFIYAGSLSERNQQRAVETLLPYKNKLKELIDDGVHMLFTGNSIELLGDYIDITKLNGEKIRFDGLGLFPFYVKSTMAKRFYSGVLADMNGIGVVGFKSQFGHIYDLPEKYGFMNCKLGPGVNPDVKYEGIHVNNFYATYLLGPFLVLNPLFAKMILKSMGLDYSIPFEETAMKSYQKRIEEFNDPKRKIAH